MVGILQTTFFNCIFFKITAYFNPKVAEVWSSMPKQYIIIGSDDDLTTKNWHANTWQDELLHFRAVVFSKYHNMQCMAKMFRVTFEMSHKYLNNIVKDMYLIILLLYFIILAWI